MKILLHSYNTCFQNAAGGMQSRIQEFKTHLEERPDISVDYFSPACSKLEEYDILHLFRLDIENYSLVQYAKKKGIGIVISSVVPLVGERNIDFLRLISKLPLLTTYKMTKSQFDAANTIITETIKEKKFIHEHYKILMEKMQVIPNGMSICNDEANNEILDIIGGHDKDYVLTVGRVDSNKNQLNLIRAMKETNIQLVIIGGPDNYSKNYYEQCLTESRGCKNIHMLGWVDNNSTLLKSAYAHCKLFVLPSFKETFGMSILEAVSAGANIALSNTLPILDYKVFDSVVRFSPDSIESMKDNIVSAYRREMSISDREAIIREFSWERVIDLHIKCYSDIISHKS